MDFPADVGEVAGHTGEVTENFVNGIHFAAANH